MTIIIPLNVLYSTEVQVQQVPLTQSQRRTTATPTSTTNPQVDLHQNPLHSQTQTVTITLFHLSMVAHIWQVVMVLGSISKTKQHFSELC